MKDASLAAAHAAMHKTLPPDLFSGLLAISADAGKFVIEGLKKEGIEATGYDVNFANPNFDQYVST